MLETITAPRSAMRRRPQLPAKPSVGPVTLSRNAPASQAMTDFLCETPLSAAPDRLVDDALGDMKRLGVRALLIADGDDVLGLVTANDILGEKPVQFLSNPVCDHYPCTRADVHVGDVMTTVEMLPVLEWTWVADATLADLESTFQATSHTHLLVVQHDSATDAWVIRGLLSRTRLNRHLGRE